MGYLPQFKNDLFLSYRRASNEGPDAWIDTFRTQVETVLRDRVGDISIWRDKDELNAGEAWRPAIAEGIDTLGPVSGGDLAHLLRQPRVPQGVRPLSRPAQGRRGDGLKLVPIFKHPPKPDQELLRELAEIGHHEFFVREARALARTRPQAGQRLRALPRAHGRVLFELAEAIEALYSQQKKQALGKVFRPPCRPS
ncbi:hypothetical protein PEC18_37865 [Paucibacter sp. O1-1]|nr:hypothetical protein [Paucibacter sp. O1-1]MDA3831395.1 hypothetical protein [Paucibacter sp. O1-1]